MNQQPSIFRYERPPRVASSGIHRPPTIMISSTVHGQTELLDQVYAVLSGFGYTVWMSHAGTIPLDPNRSNFENCIRAVDDCSLFLGIITGRYGSGRQNGQTSITHQEILRAIEMGKPRWFLVHRDVEVARQLLRQFRFTKHRPPRLSRSFRLRPTAVLEDARTLEMYESAMAHDKPLADRKGNWVQPFDHSQDALRFIDAQFADLEAIKKLLAQIQTAGGDG